MITKTVHLPKVYDGENAVDINGYCELIEGILRRALVNSLIFLDDRGQMESASFAYLDRWPRERRRRIQEIWSQLQERHRIVRLRANSEVNVTHAPCTTSFQVAAAGEADFCLYLEPCSCASRCYDIGKELKLVEVREYNHEVVQKIKQVYEIREGDNSDIVGQQLLKPIVEWAKRISIIDKYIGRKSENGQVLPDQWQKSLRYIAKVVATYSKNVNKVELRVITAVFHPEEARQDPLAYLRGLCDLMEQLHVDYGIKCRLRVYVQRKGGPRMIHERRLITDQVGVIVDGGFELFNRETGEMRRNVLTVADDSEAVWSVLHRMERLVDKTFSS